jgi:hypothetical protein
MAENMNIGIMIDIIEAKFRFFRLKSFIYAYQYYFNSIKEGIRIPLLEPISGIKLNHIVSIFHYGLIVLLNSGTNNHQ